MRVILEDSILDKIDKAILEANKHNRKIKEIILTRPEWDEFKSTFQSRSQYIWAFPIGTLEERYIEPILYENVKICLEKI